MSITVEEAKKLLRQKIKAKTSLVDFAKYVDIPGVPVDEENIPDSRFQVVETPLAFHHELILDALDRMVKGKLQHKGKVVRRVMLMFPPGSAKSTYASVVFPPWFMGNNPESEVIITGYGDVIAKRHGKRARQLVMSPSYKAVFGETLDPAMKASDDWRLKGNKAAYKAAGILSGITGFRCDGLIWDDLIKGRKDADSETIRSDTWNAYIDDARSRKKPNAWEVGIGTRWHEDEPMGRILPEGWSGESGYIKCRDGNVWLVLCCAAQCEREDDPLQREKGEYIWPEWFNEEYWNDKKVNPRSWASLYQQRPAPDEGIYFQKPWFRHYDHLPSNLNYYIAFDPAVTESEDGDDTAIGLFGVDDHAKIHLIDEWVNKVTMDKWIDQPAHVLDSSL